MNTRRTAATALLSLPMISGAAKVIEFESQTQEVDEVRKAPVSFNSGQISEDAVRIISYTIYAEARGEPFSGKKAVAAVIHTRSQLHKISMPEVCLQEKQFSCWNSISSVPAYYAAGTGLRQADVKARSDCYGLAWLLVAGFVKWDYLTHFYNPDKASPSWRSNMRGVQSIGKHVFGYIN
ncbi:cell wall hydrolase [Pontiellaceae bacterium B1224]|nr:cell wall hydrolase [Pontiellaceae bacterium B1224]